MAIPQRHRSGILTEFFERYKPVLQIGAVSCSEKTIIYSVHESMEPAKYSNRFDILIGENSIKRGIVWRYKLEFQLSIASYPGLWCC
jgi:hypothetical protein